MSRQNPNINSKYVFYVNAPALRSAKIDGNTKGILMVHEIGVDSGYDIVHYCDAVQINGPAKAVVNPLNPFNGDCGEVVSAWLETDAEIVLTTKWDEAVILPAKEPTKKTQKVKVVGGSLEIELS